MQELMKKHKITQAQLMPRIGSTKSAISRFVSGRTDKIVHTSTITPEMIAVAITQSVARMNGAQKEASDKFGQALAQFFQSTLEHAQEQKNTAPEQ